MMENFTNIPANLTGTRDNSSVPIECGDIFCRPDDEYLDYLEDYVFPDDWEWGIIILYAVTFIVGLSGNVLVCFAVWRNRSMRTVTNIFIVNLAIADLAVIIICLPPTLLSDVTETWYFGFAMCKIALFLQVRDIRIRAKISTNQKIRTHCCKSFTFYLQRRSALNNCIVPYWRIFKISYMHKVFNATHHEKKKPSSLRNELYKPKKLDFYEKRL